MKSHPIAESLIYKANGTAVSIIAAAVLWLLLYLYGNLSVFKSALEGFVYLLVLVCAGYFYWYIIDGISNFLLRVTIALVVQFLCILTTYIALIPFEQQNLISYSSTLPLFIVYGLLCWIIIDQWYRILIKTHQFQLSEEREVNYTQVTTKDADIIDKISTKEGSQIHIVRIEELQYIQAYGDYVMLFTDDKKHLKEQTMKYFEQHLPMSFVRIHRSCIVNSEKIHRVELFGKESYNVYLKNGVCLRASTTGYKLLKERLLL